MNSKNINEWLAIRDSRTNKAIGSDSSVYRSYSVTIRIDGHLATSYEGQVMLLTTINILASWCNNVQIVCPKARTIIPNTEKNLLELLEMTYLKANPMGTLIINGRLSIPSNTQILIGEGASSINHIEGNSIWIDGAGWLSGVGSKKRDGASLEYNKQNPLGPAFAACLGVSEVFRRAIGVSDDEGYEQWYSLYNFVDGKNPEDLINPSFEEHKDFGVMYQLGCGAIGSSFSYLLSLTKWEGQLHLIDFDSVELHNLSSSLLFTTDDLQVNTYKADACTRILECTGVKPEPHISDYNKFVEDGLLEQFPPDVILCFANDRNIWSTIQQNYPPLTIHSTTTKSWGINFGRHIPLKEWCIMCRFHTEIDSIYVPVCGEASIPTQNKEDEVLASLPFLSPASAILALSEIAKLGLEKYPVNENFLEYSFKAGHQGIFLPTSKAPTPCYVCKGQDAEIYEQIIRVAKY
jgi:hypothetical protein